MCKAGTRKNATGRSTPKTEHARTNCEIMPKSKANFEKILFWFFVLEIHTHPGIKKVSNKILAKKKCYKIMKFA